MRGTGWLAAAVEGLLVSLVAVGLFASAMFLPLLGAVLTPIPFVVMALRHGRVAMLLSLAAAGLMVAVPVSPKDALVFVLWCGLAAVLMSEGLRRNVRSEVLVVSVAAALAVGGLVWVTLSQPEWAGPVQAVRAQLRDLVAGMETVRGRMGFPAEGEVAIPVATLAAFLFTAFPALLFTACLMAAASYVGLLLAMLRRWPAQLGGLSPAAFRWELPEVLVWAFIGSGVLYLTGVPWLYAIGVNGLIILLGLYFLQGLSIAAFLFERFKLPRFLATLSVVLLVFQPLFTLLVAGLGLFDVWFAFRRLSLPKNSRGAT